MSAPRWIAFQRVSDGWTVRSKRHGDLLGDISWYAPWQRYVFEGFETCVFDAECLRDIAAFCDAETTFRRSGPLHDKANCPHPDCQAEQAAEKADR